MGRNWVKDGSKAESTVKIVISDLENLYIPSFKQKKIFWKIFDFRTTQTA